MAGPHLYQYSGIIASAAKVGNQDSHQFLDCPRSLSSISA